MTSHICLVGISAAGRERPPASDHAAQGGQEGGRQSGRVQRHQAADRGDRARSAPAARPTVHASAGAAAKDENVQRKRDCVREKAAAEGQSRAAAGRSGSRGRFGAQN